MLITLKLKGVNMQTYIKKEPIEKFMIYHRLTKNHFSKNCGISVKTFDKLMAGNPVRLYIALQISGYMKIEYEKLFYFKHG